MPAVFPTTPTNGQIYTYNGVDYAYNANVGAWTIATSISAGSVDINGTLTVRDYIVSSKTVANTSISPFTANTLEIVHVSGTSYINLDPAIYFTVNANTVYTDVTSVIIFTTDSSGNTILDDAYWNPDLKNYSYLDRVLVINANNYYSGYFEPTGNTNEWSTAVSLAETFNAGDPITITIPLLSNPKPWINFDDIVSDYKSSKLTYRIIVEDRFGANGYTEIGEIFSIKNFTTDGNTANGDPVYSGNTSIASYSTIYGGYADSYSKNFMGNYETGTGGSVGSRLRVPLLRNISVLTQDPINWSKITLTNITYNSNQLDCSPLIGDYGNIAIQWSGTIFSGKDW